MRMPWNKSKEIQLDLLDDAATESPVQGVDDQVEASGLDGPPDTRATSHAPPSDAHPPSTRDGRPLLVSMTRLYEDPNNPRTEFPEADLEELAIDMRQRGVLQPLVVRPADGEGRHRIHFGAKRLRAAIRAGLHEVPVVVRDVRADRYAQVAENQKRQGLTPLELARFIRVQADAGRLERDHRQATWHEPEDGRASPRAARFASRVGRGLQVGSLHLAAHAARAQQIAR